jgi:hypothetical protein
MTGKLKLPRCTSRAPSAFDYLNEAIARLERLERSLADAPQRAAARRRCAVLAAALDQYLPDVEDVCCELLGQRPEPKERIR